MPSGLAQKLKAAGWQGLPQAALRSLRFRATAAVADFHWNRLLTSPLLGRLFPFRQPAILLLSYPRSGSDWIAHILAMSPDLAYLREPINQGIRHALKSEATAPVLTTERKLALCAALSETAFAGIPPRHLPHVVQTAQDFHLLGRGNKTLLIKEVIPMAAELLVTRHAPKTVILLRHPAAIADSFIRMGWLQGEPEEMAYHYGQELSQAIAAAARGWSEVILYERLATDPLAEFTRLFTRLQVCQPPQLQQLIVDYCSAQNEITAPYQTRRSSQFEANKWRQNLHKPALEAIRRGYFRSSLDYYREDFWWS